MRQSGKTVLVVGATGLVGREVVELALADALVTRVVAPTRRALPERVRLVNPVVDFDALPGNAGWWAADAIVGTLGTTLKRAGSREAFRRVDFTTPPPKKLHLLIVGAQHSCCFFLSRPESDAGAGADRKLDFTGDRAGRGFRWFVSRNPSPLRCRRREL